MKSGKLKPNGKVITRIVVCACILLIGVIGMSALARLKKQPAEVRFKERPLGVETIRVEPEDVPVIITGHGEVKTLDVVSLSPEVSGKVVKIHPRLEIGEVIAKGEMLFGIDTRDYEAAYKDALAMVRQLENSILRLEKRYAIDRERLKTLERNRDLARAQYNRIRKLFKEDSVGTLSGVDQAEQTFNSALDQTDQMSLTLELYPIQIREAENSLASAQAKLTTAKSRLERCEVKAPFDGRIKEVSLEEGQYVAPGSHVITLANDAILEIQVPLDSQDASKWLRFSDKQSPKRTAWFNGLEKVGCKIYWTETSNNHSWEGVLHRVVRFDQQTRTLTVAIRIEAQNAISTIDHRLPLVEGMFCSIEIPGRTLRNVFVLPRWSVSFENSVYLSVNNRLKTMPVEVARIEGERAFVSAGLSPGDEVIITRLVDPLENSLLEIVAKEKKEI